MPSEDTKEQEKDMIGDIGKQDQYHTEIKQTESMINKNKKEDHNEEEELQNATKRVNKNGLEQTISTKKRNKENENEDGFQEDSFQEETSLKSEMVEKSGTRVTATYVPEFLSDEQTIRHSEDSNGQLAYKRIWEPMICYWPGKEIHYFMGHTITITESYDSYGAVIWPAAVALCKFLETPAGREIINLLDKTVLELGAGTGLLSIVATLLGAKLTASDLPEILGNLRCNLNRNTRMLRKHEPQVIELSWGNKLEETFPHCTHHYDYVLAADVVYHHDFLEELLATMHHFCQPGTTLIWANKIRYPTDLEFAEKFQKLFNVTLLEKLDEIRIFSATYKSTEENPFVRG